MGNPRSAQCRGRPSGQFVRRAQKTAKFRSRAPLADDNTAVAQQYFVAGLPESRPMSTLADFPGVAAGKKIPSCRETAFTFRKRNDGRALTANPSRAHFFLPCITIR